MDDLKFLLIDRLKSKGIDPSLIPAFLKALTYIISSEPEIGLAQTNRKMHSLGWPFDHLCMSCGGIIFSTMEFI